MYHNYDFDHVSQALPRLLLDLDKKGDEVSSRAGATKELTHVGITLRTPWRREILLEHRKPNLAAQIAETVWVLAGHDDIGWLGHYLPRAQDFSDDGLTWRAGYGRRLRSWPRRDGSDDTIDQIRWVVDHLRDSNSSRQAVACIWDPVIDTQPGKDIPCNDWLNFSSRHGELDLHVALRSNDVIWGWSGINQFEWSTLLEVVAGLLGLKTGALHFSTTSFHIYDRHWKRGREVAEAAFLSWPAPVFDSPRFDADALSSKDIEGLDDMLTYWLQLEKCIRNGDTADQDVNDFPEPMFRSWLKVLQWWWTGDKDYLYDLEGTALARAARLSVQPKREQAPEVVELRADDQVVASRVTGGSLFLNETIKLHNDKHAAYGDSWKRRGEMLGIMANIARKVDRLGGGSTADETSADTAIDLMVYLAKYRTWLSDERLGTNTADTPDAANALLAEVESVITTPREVDTDVLEHELTQMFDELERLVTSNRAVRHKLVEAMLIKAYMLARTLWTAERAEQDA